MALPDGYVWSRTSASFHFVIKTGFGMVMSVQKHPRKRQWRVRDVRVAKPLAQFEELGDAKRFCEVTLTLTGDSAV